MKDRKSKLTIVMYHYIRDISNSRYSGIKGMEVKSFVSQLEWMANRFTFVTMEEVISARNDLYDLPPNPILLTFDDGYIDHYTNVFPLLDQYGIQGSFFVPAQTFVEHKLLDVNKIHFILSEADHDQLLEDLLEAMDYYRCSEYNYPSNEILFEKYAVESRFDDKRVVFIKRVLQTVLPPKIRETISSELFSKYVGIPETTFANELYLSERQMETMKRHGMFFGIHAYEHNWLGNETDNDMKSNIDRALDAMSAFVDNNCWVMNYPYGSYNDNVINYIKRRGAVLGLTTVADYAYLSENEYLLSRFDCNDFFPMSDSNK